jgi:putative transposase
MPSRTEVLANGEIYHIYNRAIDGRVVFKSKREFQRALSALWYYRHESLTKSLSAYLRLGMDLQSIYREKLKDIDLNVNVLCFCLMSNHLHLLIKQVKDNGISQYLANVQNSYTRYFNIIKDRKGPIFLNQFKAIRIETDEQLIHVSRYIHLNPYTGYVVKTLEELESYPWSSFSEYLGYSIVPYQFCDKGMILGYFNGNKQYKKFVVNQADYQRELERIKHLTFEM